MLTKLYPFITNVFETGLFLLLWLQNLTAYSFAKSNSFEPIQLYHPLLLLICSNCHSPTFLYIAGSWSSYPPLDTLMLHKTVHSVFVSQFLDPISNDFYSVSATLTYILSIVTTPNCSIFKALLLASYSLTVFLPLCLLNYSSTIFLFNFTAAFRPLLLHSLH